MKILKRITVIVIKFYKIFISPLFPPRCRFYPTCSSYALLALEERDYKEAMVLILKRLSRCHPFHGGGYDPLPGKRRKLDDSTHS